MFCFGYYWVSVKGKRAPRSVRLRARAWMRRGGPGSGSIHPSTADVSFLHLLLPLSSLSRLLGGANQRGQPRQQL